MRTWKSAFKFHNAAAAAADTVPAYSVLLLNNEETWAFCLSIKCQILNSSLFFIEKTLHSLISGYILAMGYNRSVSNGLQVSFFSTKPQIYKKQMFSKRNLFGIIFTPDFLCGLFFYGKKNRPWPSLHIFRRILKNMLSLIRTTSNTSHHIPRLLSFQNHYSNCCLGKTGLVHFFMLNIHWWCYMLNFPT